jgi:hypothetical protein
MTDAIWRAAEAWSGPLWLLCVAASLVLPGESGPARMISVALMAASAGAWVTGSMVVAGRLPLPRSWVDQAKRPLSSRALLLMGAAIGPILSFFVLACLRVIAYGPEPYRTGAVKAPDLRRV